METRTRSAKAKPKVKKVEDDDTISEQEDKTPQNSQGSIAIIDQTSCDEVLSCEHAINESGDAGQIKDQCQGQNRDTPKDVSPMKRNVESETTLADSPSPAKQQKLADEDVDLSITKHIPANSPDDVSVCDIDNKENTDNFNDDCDNEAAAEEIVQKLCKNGKVLTLTEGEKYFKVIVYEDSEENQEESDGHATRAADDNKSQQNLLQKIVDGDFDDEETQSEHDESPHVLTERTNSLGNMPTSVTAINSQVIPVMQQAVADSAQWYSDVCSPPGYSHTPPAAAIQSNFAQTMSQFAPPFMTCSLQEPHDLDSPFSNSENMQPQFIKPMGPQPAGSQKLYCTPHPKNGQYMFYYTDQDGNNTRSDFIPFNTSTPLGRPRQKAANKSKSVVTPSSVTLNSSGEENISPPDHLPNVTPTVGDKKSRMPRTRLDPDIEIIGEDGTLREQHNQKERRRRARIKEACDLMRQLVPGMSDKTDKATVFEFGARYIHFLKSFIGTEHDKDFLMKYSPY